MQTCRGCHVFIFFRKGMGSDSCSKRRQVQGNGSNGLRANVQPQAAIWMKQEYVPHWDGVPGIVVCTFASRHDAHSRLCRKHKGHLHQAKGPSEQYHQSSLDVRHQLLSPRCKALQEALDRPQ